MRPPNGVSTQTRQSPSSSRTRSTTIVRSSGTAPVASSWSFRYCRKFSAASLSRSCFVVRRLMASPRLASRLPRAVDCGGAPLRGRRGAADAGGELLDVPGVDGDQGHELLREHVEWIAR